jgi:diacylglycerol diphosphate phosphatase/phosphatidate phosphatase
LKVDVCDLIAISVVHSAGIFSGMGYLSLYLAGKLEVIKQKYHPWKFLPIFLPLLVATFVGISRIDDYHHHSTDVLVGAIMGLGVACFCYGQFFPSMWDEYGDALLNIFHLSF